MLDDMNLIDFPVETQPVFDQLGNEIQGSKCVVRTDTNAVLGVHGSRYHLVKHSNIVDRVYDAVQTANISQDFQIKFSLADNGAKMRGDIIFPNITIAPKVGDISQFRVSFTNSYDASWSFSMMANALRLLCTNGMVTPNAYAHSKYKHTMNINIEGAANKVRIGLDGFFNEESNWKAWQQVHVSDAMAEKFFKATIAKSPSRQIIAQKSNEKQLESLLSIWAYEKSVLGPNKWALYNAMTYWSTHTSDLKNPIVARQRREDQVMSAMQDKHFTLLENAQ